MNRFEYVTPSSVEDAVRSSTTGWDSRFIAGGTDLLHEMKHSIESPSRLINVKAIGGLDTIGERADDVTIGALVTLSAIERSEVVRTKFPILYRAAFEAASP